MNEQIEEKEDEQKKNNKENETNELKTLTEIECVCVCLVIKTESFFRVRIQCRKITQQSNTISIMEFTGEEKK